MVSCLKPWLLAQPSLGIRGETFQKEESVDRNADEVRGIVGQSEGQIIHKAVA